MVNTVNHNRLDNAKDVPIKYKRSFNYVMTV